MSLPTPPQLDYAPQPPLHRRRRFRQFAIGLILLVPIVFEPASLTGAPVLAPTFPADSAGKDVESEYLLRDRLSAGYGGRHIRVYLGQPDAADPTHFSLSYEVDGQKGTIDGWLRDDDTVKLQVRDGPAKEP